MLLKALACIAVIAVSSGEACAVSLDPTSGLHRAPLSSSLVAGPALSTARDEPRVVDFVLRPGGHARAQVSAMRVKPPDAVSDALD